MSVNGILQRKLRLAMVGGGRGSFIGSVHATASQLDGRARLVAGALSSDPERARESARDFDLDPDRAHGSFEELLESEGARGPDERVDAIIVCTPNHLHFEQARRALEAGFHVFCDKPLTLNLEEAEALAGVVRKGDRLLVLTHNYTGYPLVRQARDMVRAGELGEVQAFRVNYVQGWWRTRLELEGHKQAEWRNDPSRAGAAGTFADIGTHAFHLARTITGLLPEEICCQLKTFEEGRALDDYGHAVVRLENEGLGTITCSQISHGRENDLSIQIDGTRGSLEWRQEDPNQMTFRQNGKPHAIYTRDPSAPHTTPLAAASCRIPWGHPEGFLEAFANIYTAGYDAIIEQASGKPAEHENTIYPNVHDGVEGMYFLEQSVESSARGAVWLPLKHELARR